MIGARRTSLGARARAAAGIVGGGGGCVRGRMFEDGHLLDPSLEGVVRVGGGDDEFASDEGAVT